MARLNVSRFSRYKFVLPLVVVLLLELFAFNLQFWGSLGNSPREATVSADKGVQQVAPGVWQVDHPEQAFVRVDLPAPLDLRLVELAPRLVPATALAPEAPPAPGPLGLQRAGANFNVNFWVGDAANETSEATYGRAEISEFIPASHYVPLHAAAPVRSLRLQFLDLAAGSRFSLPTVELNPHRPFTVDPLRVSLLLAVAYLVYAFAPRSRIYRWRLDLRVRRQLGLTLVAAACCCLVLCAITRLIQPARLFAEPYNIFGFIGDENQYNHYANALLAGHASLDLPVPSYMLDMVNPYDAVHRQQLGVSTSQPAYFDYAYYQGKYYSYFGVLPVLLAFVPFKLLTGSDLRTDYAVALFACLFTLAVFYFFAAAFKRYFERTTFGFYLLSCLGLVVGVGTFNQVYLPKIYSLPMLCSLFLTLLGLGMWMSARRRTTTAREGDARPAALDPQQLGDVRLNKWLLAGGSLAIALNLFARPSFVLAAFLALPLFWPEIRARLFFSRRGLANTACVVVPFFAAGLPAMWWNQVRFGSPFDFGAKYNLTGFDMVHHAQTLARIPIGIAMYLFQPFNVTPDYPFLRTTPLPETFMGRFIMEPYFGGFFFFAPAALLLALAVTRRATLRKYRLGSLVALCALLALVLIAVDSMVVGVNTRYFSDFGWLLLIAAAFTVQAVLEESSELAIPSGATGQPGGDEALKRAGFLPGEVRVGARGLQAAYCGLTFAALVLGGLNLFSDGRYLDLRSFNGTLYRLVESWFVGFH